MFTVVSWVREKDEDAFARFFAPHTDLRLVNARTHPPDLEEMAGLLLTGGPDISAHHLRQPVENPAHIEDAEPARDGWEFAAAARALAREIPIFAICKGHQVLNVALGGTLRLDIPGHRAPEAKYGNIQPLRYEPGAAIVFPYVNSSHHQAIDRPGDGLGIEAWSARDEVIEQVRLRDFPYALGVQFHPERDLIYAPLFEEFFAHVKRTRP